VNRANLKFISLSTTKSRVSVRNMNESEREGEKQLVSLALVTIEFDHKKE
jgi:hypothetical protein